MRKYLFVAIVATLLSATNCPAAGPTNVKASLDSAYLLMGKQTTLNINIVQDRDVKGHFTPPLVDTLTRDIEIARMVKPDTSALGSGREEIRQAVIIQAFDSGLYTIPPLVYVANGDTFTTEELVLKVEPVAVDTLATIHDFADVANADTRFWDYLPDFIVDYWWIILVILLVGGGFALWWFKFRGHNINEQLMPKPKPIPPYEAAMQQLEQLRSEKLCDVGREREFYTRLTEILRTYLDHRFGINAMEMTSTQIMSRLRENPDTRNSAPLMKQVLEMADFVKFAKVRPLPDDNIKSFAGAVSFVEATKPVPEVAPTDPQDHVQTPKQ